MNGINPSPSLERRARPGVEPRSRAEAEQASHEVRPYNSQRTESGGSAGISPAFVSDAGRTPALPVSAPARALLGGVWLYQHTLSPALPAVFGPACGCRFQPTCSHYAAEAVRTHGALAGAWLAARRLLKCSPLHPGGDDPVPERFGNSGVGGVPSPRILFSLLRQRGEDTPPTTSLLAPARPRCARVTV